MTTPPALQPAEVASTSSSQPRTYDVRTHGCQMNVHDSERLSGLLETAGYVDVSGLPVGERPELADVVVFNTCAVRENADNKLYGNLGQLRAAKLRKPEMQIAVGGCMAQKDRGMIVERAPWVDVTRPTAAGCRSPSAATTPAPSASCPPCAARSRTADPARSWPR